MKDHRTLNSNHYFTKISIRFPEGDSAEPVLVLHTKQFEDASDLLRIFPVSILTVNRQSLKKLPVKTQLDTAGDEILALELSLDDPYPSNIIDRIVIPNDLLKRLQKWNAQHKWINFELQEEKRLGKPRTAALPPIYKPYLVDWRGTQGLIFYLRLAQGNRPNPGLLHSLELHVEKYGPATGLYYEMGYLNRLAENWDKAIDCYRKEIRFGLKSDGLPGIGGVRALNNMGVVYKKLGDLKLARHCLVLALSINPNYFEALVTLAGLMEQEHVAMSCLARAFAINSAYAGHPQLFRGAADFWQRDAQLITQYIQHEASQMDLSHPSIQVVPQSIPAIMNQLGI